MITLRGNILRLNRCCCARLEDDDCRTLPVYVRVAEGLNGFHRLRSGTVTISMLGESTPPIPYDAPLELIKYHLESLSAVRKVGIITH